MNDYPSTVLHRMNQQRERAIQQRLAMEMMAHESASLEHLHRMFARNDDLVDSVAAAFEFLRPIRERPERDEFFDIGGEDD